MIQTINIINTQNPSSRKRIAVCNLTFETTATEDQVKSALEKALPIAFDKIKKNHSPANMAMVMQVAVEMAQEKYPDLYLATVYKGNIIKNLIMDCQSYTKYRPNETTGGIFVSWRRKEELPTGA